MIKDTPFKSELVATGMWETGISSLITNETRNYLRTIRELPTNDGEFSIVRHDNSSIYGGWGFVIPSGMDDLSLITQPPTRWQRPHLEHIKTRFARANLGELEHPYRVSKLDKAVFNLSFPGAYTYGHWLLDILPSLYFARRLVDSDLLEQVAYVLPPLQSWMRQFLEIYQLSSQDVIATSDYQRIYAPRIYESLGVRKSVRFNKTLFNAYVRDLRLRLDRGGVSRVQSGRLEARKLLYVKKTTQTSSHAPRRLLNEAQLEETLRRYGAFFFDPVNASIQSQFEVFSSYDVIIGEDSSALHNVIFNSSSQTILIVLAAPRISNLLHAAIADALDIKVVMLHGLEISNESTETEFVVDINRISDILDSVLGSTIANELAAL
jgi:capsular polysaccharide biosynthesis protein